MRPNQYHRTKNPFTGLAESVITSNVMFLGDSAMAVFSWSTNSNGASRLTLQGYEGTGYTDGFASALPAPTADGWQDIKVATAQGYYSLDTIPRWARFLRAPSLSSMTLMLTYHVGP